MKNLNKPDRSVITHTIKKDIDRCFFMWRKQVESHQFETADLAIHFLGGLICGAMLTRTNACGTSYLCKDWTEYLMHVLDGSNWLLDYWPLSEISSAAEHL